MEEERKTGVLDKRAGADGAESKAGAAGGAEDKLRIVPTLQDAQNILAKELGAGDCVLFLNDLPDIY